MSLHHIYLIKVDIATVRQPMDNLPLPEDNPIWCRPIELFVTQDFIHQLLQDASYAGLGGWSPCFKYKQQILCDDLATCGFPMKKVLETGNKPITGAQGLHINPLEFIAAILNL